MTRNEFIAQAALQFALETSPRMFTHECVTYATDLVRELEKENVSPWLPQSAQGQAPIPQAPCDSVPREWAEEAIAETLLASTPEDIVLDANCFHQIRDRLLAGLYMKSIPHGQDRVAREILSAVVAKHAGAEETVTVELKMRSKAVSLANFLAKFHWYKTVGIAGDDLLVYVSDGIPTADLELIPRIWQDSQVSYKYMDDFIPASEAPANG